LSNVPARAWQSERDTIAQLMQRLEESEKRLAESERRIQALEQKLGMASPEAAPAAPPAADAEVQAAIKAAQAAAGAHHGDATQGHNMQLPGGGPVLNIRGFFDFNFGTGSIANPLVFPISDNGCGTCGNQTTPPHSAFQAGEFDLFMSSRLSDHLSFLGELVLGPSATNEFGIDIERYQLTYSRNRYFSASAGRFHTSIGYYNTAYHHGNWFSTAEGRPIMYLFEDSGGILPVHMVGVSLTGEVPHTDSLGLHWVAELGNGLSSNPAEPEGVQNFYSDRNYKATNFAAFIRPRVLPGLQVGASWYHDGLRPSQAENPLPIPEVRQNIYSAHVVYFSPNWEFMNEGVLLSNHTLGAREPFRSPMAYTQVARKLGIYKPYFRFQYADDNAGDPVNFLKGLYYGPSVGVRVDFSDYAAFKLQYNRLLMGRLPAANGLNAQVAFTF
jgi:TolA-binding protein